MDSDRIGSVLLALGLIVGIVAGGLYISEHISCFNFFGLAKGCVAH